MESKDIYNLFLLNIPAFYMSPDRKNNWGAKKCGMIMIDSIIEELEKGGDINEKISHWKAVRDSFLNEKFD